MTIGGLIPPILKIVFDNRLKNSKEMIEWVHTLTEGQEMDRKIINGLINDRDEEHGRALKAEKALIDFQEHAANENQLIRESIRKSDEDIARLKEDLRAIKSIRESETDE